MKHIPNILSALRILMVPAFLYFYWQDDISLIVLGFIIFLMATVTDFLDGYIARKYNYQSALGAFLDPLADKFLTFSAFISLPLINNELFPWWAICIILFRDIFITLLRVWAKYKNATMKTRIIGKVKTVVQFVFLYFVLFLGAFKGYPSWLGVLAKDILSNTEIIFSLTVFVVAFTVYSGIEYTIKNSRLFSF
ncbi:MAG: CDP-diacylglycerol--glycerol-3-phosphate 3-phosphatidyltransferase [Chitinophagales bacterium]|nr:CDP-diacylglycerol--glycerol-3-phosphate 3-phosphatidyltransferase [Chitinophagales bacterium]